MGTRATTLRTRLAERARRNSPAKRVDELPLNGRDFSAVVAVSKRGTMTDVNGPDEFHPAVCHQRTSAALRAVFAMDGADVSDPEMGGSTFTNFDGGRDFRNYSQASGPGCRRTSGRGAAGFYPILWTRSGKKTVFTDHFFEFLRNSRSRWRGNYFDHPSIGGAGQNSSIP